MDSTCLPLQSLGEDNSCCRETVLRKDSLEVSCRLNNCLAPTGGYVLWMCCDSFPLSILRMNSNKQTPSQTSKVHIFLCCGIMCFAGFTVWCNMASAGTYSQKHNPGMKDFCCLNYRVPMKKYVLWSGEVQKWQPRQSTYLSLKTQKFCKCLGFTCCS